MSKHFSTKLNDQFNFVWRKQGNCGFCAKQRRLLCVWPISSCFSLSSRKQAKKNNQVWWHFPGNNPGRIQCAKVFKVGLAKDFGWQSTYKKESLHVSEAKCISVDQSAFQRVKKGKERTYGWTKTKQRGNCNFFSAGNVSSEQNA